MAKKKSAKDKGAQMFQDAQARNQTFTNAKGKNPVTLTQTGFMKGRQSSTPVAPTVRTAPGTAVIPPITDEEKANALLDADYAEGKTAEQDLFGDTVSPDSYEAYQKQRALELTDKYETNRLAQEEAKKATAYAYGQNKSSMQNQTANQVAGLYAGGREGPMSESNISAANSLGQNLATRSKRLDEERSAAISSLDQAEADLQAAYRDGRQSLIDAARSNYANAEMAVSEIETNLLNAQTEASAESRAALSSFQSLVDEGQELSVEAISGFANQLGLKFEDAYGYYAGVQSIRDDKALSLEEKEVAIAQATQNLQDQLTGMDTQAAKATKAYISLVQSGADEATIAAFKQMAGITDYNDPFTVADLKLKQAQANIASAQAEGRIVSPLEQQELIKAQYENWELMGYTPGVIPQGGSYGVTPNEDGSISVNVSTGFDAGQCGKFVNDVFGDRIFGDSYESKAAWIDPSIKVPEAGMAFVMETESSYGHVGLVESVDPSTGMMTVVDSNWGNNEKVQRREVPISSVSGFVRPPNSISAEAGSSLAALPEDQQKVVKDYISTFKGEETVKNYNIAKEGFDFVSSIDVDTDNPADDIAMIYGLAKALDPSSVVREGEYATVSKYVQNWADQFGFDAKRVFSNTVFLTPEARQSILDTVGSRFGASQDSYNRVRTSYLDTLTNVYGIPSADSYFIDYSSSSVAGEGESDGLDLGFSSSSFDPMNLLD